jgi:prephenate dehydrogenase
MKKRVGILGNGSFGAFLVSKLNSKFDLFVYDPNTPDAMHGSSVQEVATCDFLILAIPLDAYPDALEAIKPYILESTVLVDISSVKTTPVTLLDKYLPGQKRVITHPLFGPQSAQKSYWGHVVIMCPSVSTTDSYADIRDFVISEGLAVVEKTPEEHDREMAYAQGLTFFLARTLITMGIHDVSLHTPSFKKLLDISELEEHHSEELFRTIQQGNPFTGEIRTRLIQTIQQLDDQLNSKK